MDGQWDAIVIGAGHNGLAAARVLAQRGRRVLVLEKNRYVGGMAGTREILPGCRNEVGASALFPIAPEVLDFLQFERHGAEFIDLPVMAINLAGPGHKPIMFYRSPRRQLWHLLRHHGPAALAGFAKFAKFVAYPASVMDRFKPGCTPRGLDELLRDAPDEAPPRAVAPRVHRIRDGRDRPLLPRPAQAPHLPLAAGLRRDPVDLQGTLHARLRAVPGLHLRAERRQRADAAREGRHGLAQRGAGAHRSRPSAAPFASVPRSITCCSRTVAPPASC